MQLCDPRRRRPGQGRPRRRARRAGTASGCSDGPRRALDLPGLLRGADVVVEASRPRPGRAERDGGPRRRVPAPGHRDHGLGRPTAAAVEDAPSRAWRRRRGRSELQPRRRAVRPTGRRCGRPVRRAVRVRPLPPRVAPPGEGRSTIRHRDATSPAASPSGTPEAPGCACADSATRPDELEVVSLRAGASPGMHVVGFDSAGETVELRLTARDRSAYAAGILAAAAWLHGAPRTPGIHPFESVVDELLAAAPIAPVAA